jgi:hypothetical protein
MSDLRFLGHWKFRCGLVEYDTMQYGRWLLAFHSTHIAFIFNSALMNTECHNQGDDNWKLADRNIFMLQFSCSRSWERKSVSSQLIAFPQFVVTMILFAVVWSTDSCIPRNLLKFLRIWAVSTWWKCWNFQFALVTGSTLKVCFVSLLLPMTANAYHTLINDCAVRARILGCLWQYNILSTQKRSVYAILYLIET